VAALYDMKALHLGIVAVALACDDGGECSTDRGRVDAGDENASRCRPTRAHRSVAASRQRPLTFTTTTYDLQTSHRNKNNDILFDNSEQGTYARQGNTLNFTRTGGGGVDVPYLLAPGIVSADGDTVTLLYGDEGPGSDQIRAIFRR
jgi:hypothetical protein